jgi:hypothetical protein
MVQALLPEILLLVLALLVLLVDAIWHGRSRTGWDGSRRSDWWRRWWPAWSSAGRIPTRG